MITVIYPDKDTDLERYSNINSDEIIVYDNTGSINTDFKKENTVDIFSRADNIIFTQNCIINEKYDISPLKEACNIICDSINDDTLMIFDTKVPPRTVYKMSKIIDEYELIPDINLAYTTIIKEDTRIIAGRNENSLKRTCNLYENMNKTIKTTKHIQTAEMIPLLQNAYKDTLIALSNQMAILSEALTIDLIDAIDIANMNNNANIPYPQPVLKQEIVRDSSEIINLANEYGETVQLSETSRKRNCF